MSSECVCDSQELCKRCEDRSSKKASAIIQYRSSWVSFPNSAVAQLGTVHMPLIVPASQPTDFRGFSRFVELIARARQLRDMGNRTPSSGRLDGRWKALDAAPGC
jgi:hypothetical protein